MERKSRRALVDRWLLNAGAVLGSLCLVLAALSLLFGLKPLIFSSGSMGPAFPTGSLALAIPVAASEISPGEVVSVVASDGTRVTHRVVAADPDSGLVLKGDANAVADLLPYAGASVDKVLFGLPGLGYVLSWLASPWVFLLGGLLCSYLIYAAFFRTLPDAVGQPRAGSEDGTVSGAGKQRTWRRTWLGIGAMSVVVAVAVPLGAAAKVESTRAAWTANAVAGSNVAAAVLPPTGKLMCGSTGDEQMADISWTAPANSPVPVANYRITVTIDGTSKSELLPSGATTKRLSMKDGSSLLGSVLGLLVDILSLLIRYNYPVAVSVTAVYANGWESAPQNYSTMVAFNGGLLGGGKQLRC